MRVHYEQFEGNLRPYYICNEADLCRPSAKWPLSSAQGKAVT
ncbi:hypothetical protein ACI2KT_36680 [Ensifer adhaerens]